MSTTHDSETGRPKVVFRVTKLEIRLIDGEVVVRFAENAIDVTPRQPPVRRPR